MSNRIVVVTGGAQGIGRAIAEKFAAQGAILVIADLNEAGAKTVATEIGNGATGHAVDVSDSSSFSDLFDDVVATHGLPDVLVNNAGVVGSGPSAEMPDEVWDREITINLTGAFYGCREMAKRLLAANKGGAIVNVSSISGFRVTQPERHVAYDVAKAGVAQLTRVLGAEWASAGIRVNAVGPGYTDTTILRGLGITDPDLVDTWISQVPLGRMMQPSEIADGVAFLASSEASAITGHVLMVDGGYSL